MDYLLNLNAEAFNQAHVLYLGKEQFSALLKVYLWVNSAVQQS